MPSIVHFRLLCGWGVWEEGEESLKPAPAADNQQSENGLRRMCASLILKVGDKPIGRELAGER